ncbi:MAG TPA: DHHA1 domain-containing protein, partial [Gemmatimonadales bacterium]|nr:DHHA1 domain-containing protein [Gemmatimonadales bacterium]
ARIGSIFITGVERIRGRLRLGYLAGARVLSRLRECEVLLGSLAAASSAGADELARLIPARLEALRVAEKRIEALERDLGEYRMRELLADAETVARGNRRIVLDRSGASVDELLRIARAVEGGSHLCLVAASASPATVLLAASPDSGVDCGALLKEALASVNGRGGGSRGMARGTVGETAELQGVIHALLEATR